MDATATSSYYLINIQRHSELPQGDKDKPFIYEAFIMQSLEDALMAYRQKYGVPARYVYRLPPKMAGRWPPLWIRVDGDTSA